MRSAALIATFLLAAALASACGDELPGGPDGGSLICITIDYGPADFACETDSDCTFASSGAFNDTAICGNGCGGCGATAVNQTAAARVTSQYSVWTDSIECGCYALGASRCLGGQCTECVGGATAPAGCNTQLDAGWDGAAVSVDAAIATASH